jgi:hypothetical protein
MPTRQSFARGENNERGLNQDKDKQDEKLAEALEQAGFAGSTFSPLQDFSCKLPSFKTTGYHIGPSPPFNDHSLNVPFPVDFIFRFAHLLPFHGVSAFIHPASNTSRAFSFDRIAI